MHWNWFSQRARSSRRTARRCNPGEREPTTEDAGYCGAMVMTAAAHHRDMAWRRYADSLTPHHLSQESLEFAEIDFKAGYDAAVAESDSRARSGARAPRATSLRRRA